MQEDQAHYYFYACSQDHLWLICEFESPLTVSDNIVIETDAPWAHVVCHTLTGCRDTVGSSPQLEWGEHDFCILFRYSSNYLKSELK